MEVGQMTEAILMGMLLVLAIIVLAKHYSKIKRPGAGCEEPWLPRELRGAMLAFSELRFESKRHGLVARLDRAYRNGDGLHLVELKTRGYYAAHASDTIELSVQRIVLEEEIGEPVSRVAYVAVQRGGTGVPRPIRVDLLEEDEIMAMRRRLIEVRHARGRAPLPASRPKACEKCGHRRVCQRTFGDRIQ
jgi:CRISPR/Cas system-associated exonuclease Cas4 (RecB family)